jgi:hypothetical protein
MPALVAGIHVFAALQTTKTWMAGTSPAMTEHVHCDPQESKPRQLSNTPRPPRAFNKLQRDRGEEGESI